MEIRRLTPDDAREYRALMLTGYASHPDAFGSSVADREPLPLSWWEQRLDASTPGAGAVWGSFDEAYLIGVAGLRRETPLKLRHKATLFGMYVIAAHRGRGAGDALVRAVINHAQDTPELEVVQLTVTEGNRPAQALYERHGFLTFGVEPMALRLGDRFCAKVHMWRPMRADAQFHRS